MSIKMISSFILTMFCLINSMELSGQDKKMDIETFINYQIDRAVTDGLIKEKPIIIIQGFPIMDDKSKHEIFTTIIQSDIKKISVLDSEKASSIFDGDAKNGVMLIILKNSGKRKLKKLGYL